jgi:hypothetical protein
MITGVLSFWFVSGFDPQFSFASITLQIHSLLFHECRAISRRVKRPEHEVYYFNLAPRLTKKRGLPCCPSMSSCLGQRDYFTFLFSPPYVKKATSYSVYRSSPIARFVACRMLQRVPVVLDRQLYYKRARSALLDHLHYRRTKRTAF